MLRLILAVSLCLLVIGCADIAYYVQATEGQMRLMAATRPISEVVKDPTTDPVLRQQLQREMRHLDQHAVDPRAHRDGFLPRLDVQVARAEFGGVLHHAVDQRADLEILCRAFGLEILNGVAHTGVRLDRRVKARFLNCKK
jgi:predicted aminopeptidase